MGVGIIFSRGVSFGKQQIEGRAIRVFFQNFSREGSKSGKIICIFPLETKKTFFC